MRLRAAEQIVCHDSKNLRVVLETSGIYCLVHLPRVVMTPETLKLMRNVLLDVRRFALENDYQIWAAFPAEREDIKKLISKFPVFSYQFTNYGLLCYKAEDRS